MLKETLTLGEILTKDGLIYEMNGKFFIGRHGDTDVTKEVTQLIDNLESYIADECNDAVWHATIGHE